MLFEMLEMEGILAELRDNADSYSALTKRISTTVQGRICHHHVVVLSALVKLYPVRTYLEIGVHNGTSMSYVVNQYNRSLHCIGVDLFSDTTARYAHDKLQEVRTDKSIAAANHSLSYVRLIQGDSRAATTFQAVEVALEDRQVDLLFIDGDHEFAGVESDFLMYSGLVRPGGFIVFDDANTQYPGILKCVEKHVVGSPQYKILGLYENTDLIIQKV